MIINQKLIIIAIFVSLNFIVIASSQTGGESPVGDIGRLKRTRKFRDSNSALETQISPEISEVLLASTVRDCSELILDANATFPLLRTPIAVIVHIVSPELRRLNVGSGLGEQSSEVVSAVELSSGNDAIKRANFGQDPELSQFSLGECGYSQGAKGVVLHLVSARVSVEDLAGQFSRASSGLVTPNQ